MNGIQRPRISFWDIWTTPKLCEEAGDQICGKILDLVCFPCQCLWWEFSLYTSVWFILVLVFIYCIPTTIESISCSQCSIKGPVCSIRVYQLAKRWQTGAKVLNLPKTLVWNVPQFQKRIWNTPNHCEEAGDQICCKILDLVCFLCQCMLWEYSSNVCDSHVLCVNIPPRYWVHIL